jgi:hypothetical protein
MTRAADLLALILDDAPAAATSLPYLGRGATEMSPRDAAIAARSRAGDDGIDGDLVFHSADNALKQWHRWRHGDAVSVKGSSAPSRFGARVDGGRPPTLAGKLTAKLHAHAVERSVIAACALGWATSDGRVRLDAREVAVVIEGILGPISARGVAEGLAASQIADDLNAARAATGEHRVSAIHVGQCYARARCAVAEDLVKRGLLERPRDTQSPKRSDAMALPPGYDLETWKEIAGHCGFGVTRVQELSRASSDPLPVSDYFGRVVARKADVDAWRARQIRTRAAT